MENFDLDEDQIRHIQIKKYVRQHRWQPEYFTMDSISRMLLPFFVQQDEQKLTLHKIPQDLAASVTRTQFKNFLEASEFMTTFPSTDSRFFGRRSSIAMWRKASIASILSAHSEIGDTPKQTATEEQMVKYGDEYELNVIRENKDMVAQNLDIFRPLLFLAPDSSVRKFCIWISNIPVYQVAIVSCLVPSVAMAAIMDKTIITEFVQIAFLVVFLLDVAIHIIADGLIMLPKSYLRHVWNTANLCILLSQVFVLVALDGAKRDSWLRVLRVLRVMGITTYIPGMQSLLADLFYGLSKVINAIMINVLVFVPFAVYGSYLFSGRFAMCNDDGVASMHQCSGQFLSDDEDTMNILLPRVWQNPYQYSYDNFGKALLHLFENASGEGWKIVSLFSAMSIQPTKHLQPKFNWSAGAYWYSVYYVVFMFVASLCVIQLFIGVFLEIFKQRSGIDILTNTQRQFRDLQQQLALIKPSPYVERPLNTIRAFCFDLSIDRRDRFSKFMTTVLVANIVLFCTEHLHQPIWLTTLQRQTYPIFFGLYAIEVIIKILGLGLRKWMSVKWNIYDATVTFFVIIISAVKKSTEPMFEVEVIYNILLVATAFRLAQRNEALDILFRAAKYATEVEHLRV
ncbi:calcium channel protein [Apophysomyces sp. BC1021]|nr:calcium channel protein [Apophysomyces sp. BC1021]